MELANAARITFALTCLAFVSDAARATELLGVEIGSQPTEANLAAKLGIDIQSQPGSLERMGQCQNLPSGGFFGANKYKKCVNETRAPIFPIRPGFYRAKPTAFNKLWGCLVDVAVRVDAGGYVSEIIVNFQSGYFRELDSGAREKWGEPKTRATADMQNGFGAKVTAVEEHWSIDGVDVSILSNYDMLHGIMNLKR